MIRKRYKAEIFRVPSGRIVGEIVRRRPREIKVKRDCQTGRFAPLSVRASKSCAIEDRPRKKAWYVPEAGDRADRVCYRTRGEALRAFVAWNRKITDIWGLDRVVVDGEWDAVNEKYGRKGKRRIRTLAQAIDQAMPKGKPYCLDRLDLGVLNETRPGIDEGPFVLPDVVEEEKLARRLQEGYEAEEELASFEVSSSDLLSGEVPF